MNKPKYLVKKRKGKPVHLAALTLGGGQESVCGWLKDKYGLSWQVSPENWEEFNKRPGAFKKMMGMKKIIIADF
ncbi:VOC family protein [Sphingobacterium detergens]|uniref:VOC family protein n=1 Tax=Sphingobacterium detergens TaxID=1145106 RepID=UPI000E7131E2|nr:VOC family protein [Sphingobacterium detergens]